MTNFTDIPTRTPAPLTVARDAFFRFLAESATTDPAPRTSAGDERATALAEQRWEELGDFA